MINVFDYLRLLGQNVLSVHNVVPLFYQKSFLLSHSLGFSSNLIY